MSANGLLGRKNVAVFDEHRNSSRVWPVPPTALPEAEAEMSRGLPWEIEACLVEAHGWLHEASRDPFPLARAEGVRAASLLIHALRLSRALTRFS